MYNLEFFEESFIWFPAYDIELDDCYIEYDDDDDDSDDNDELDYDIDDLDVGYA
jgi:hypothetical protein